MISLSRTDLEAAIPEEEPGEEGSGRDDVTGLWYGVQYVWSDRQLSPRSHTDTTTGSR